MAIKPPINEQDLLLGTARGEQVAFAGLFHAYHNQLGAYILMLTHSKELTEEIVQDIFVKIWMKRAELPEVASFSAYLFILTRNYTLNCIRREVTLQKRQTVFEQISGKDEVEEDEPAFELPDNYEQVISRAVAQLPPQQQKVFVAKQAGKKTADIAAEMGISPVSVKKYQQWAVKSVSDFVRDHAELIPALVVLATTLKK